MSAVALSDARCSMYNGPLYAAYSDRTVLWAATQGVLAAAKIVGDAPDKIRATAGAEGGEYRRC